MRFAIRPTLAAAAGLSAALGVAGAQAAPPAPMKVIAMYDGTQNFGTTRRAVNFYEVTDISANGDLNAGLGSVFNQTPLFSVWTGYEVTSGSIAGGPNNFEDHDAMAFNPFNGTLYTAAFDSGPENIADGVGDTQGDLDLYRIDYQEILNDFVANGVAKGTMYAPTTSLNNEGVVNPQHPDHVGTTRNIAGAIQKIGEVGRTQGSSFFDRHLEFVDPQTLILLDNESDSAFDDPSVDHEIRVLERVSLSPSAAVRNASNPDSIEGGYNGSGNTQSWHSDRAGLLNLDFDAMTGMPVGQSEPRDMALVKRDGVVGVWIGELDGGGDDIAFFEFSGIGSPADDAFAALSTLGGLGTTRALDNDPEFDPTTNDGSFDFFQVDENGNLLIAESGFFDTVPGGQSGNGGPAGEPAFQRLNVAQYQTGNVDLLASDTWDDLTTIDGFGPVGSDDPGDFLTPPTQLSGPLGSLLNTFANPDGSGLSLDDDGDVTDGQFGVYDPGTKLMYLFDIDGGSLPDVVVDAYVIDTTTGTIVYEELNAVNHFLEPEMILALTRGDANGDGVVDADDIDILAANSDVAGAGALMQEMYDLTGDLNTVFSSAAGSDASAMVRGILGTEFGDANLDGMVDIDDLSALSGGFGASAGWAGGNFDGNGIVDIDDLSTLSGSFGFSAMPAFAAPSQGAVPEPSCLLLAASSLAGLGLLRRRN